MIRTLIKAIRKKSGYTQTQLAELVGLDQPSYSKFESGRGNLSNENLIKLETFLNQNYELFSNENTILIREREYHE